MDKEQTCHVSRTIYYLSKRWTIFILIKLIQGPCRFSEMTNDISISGRLLSERLKDMEAWGLVRRNIYNEMPVRIEYELTDKGRATLPILEAIRQYSEEWESSPLEPSLCEEAKLSCSDAEANCGEDI
jgi:DNA-binding HxlR family transcriptional regulator